MVQHDVYRIVGINLNWVIFFDKLGPIFFLGYVLISTQRIEILNKWREIYNNCTYLMADLLNVVALVKVKPDHIKDAEPLVKALAEASRLQPGVARYEIYRVREKVGVYLFLEQYKSEEDFANHKKTEHFLNTIAACTANQYFEEPPVIVSLEKEQI